MHSLTELSTIPRFLEICELLGLSGEAIKKLHGVKKLQTLDSELATGSLTYIESEEAMKNHIIPRGVIALVSDQMSVDQMVTINVQHPSFVFWSLFELLERSKEFSHPSKINDTVLIGRNASIATQGVVIEDGVIIDDNVAIKPGVIIKKGTKIGPGCVIGSNGLEVKQTVFGRIVVTHRGGVEIGENVEVGALCTINQGLGDRATTIAADTKIDSGVHIAHSCSIGMRNTITSNVTFGGSVVTGADVFFGLNSTIKHGIKLSDGCFVGASSFVSKSYDEPVNLVPRPSIPILK